MKEYRGIFPALVTPFDEKGRVDADRMQRLVEKNLRGWLLCGRQHSGVLSFVHG